jgi:hypothetical protein
VPHQHVAWQRPLCSDVARADAMMLRWCCFVCSSCCIGLYCMFYPFLPDQSISMLLYCGCSLNHTVTADAGWHVVRFAAPDSSTFRAWLNSRDKLYLVVSMDLLCREGSSGATSILECPGLQLLRWVHAAKHFVQQSARIAQLGSTRLRRLASPAGHCSNSCSILQQRRDHCRNGSTVPVHTDTLAQSRCVFHVNNSKLLL